MSVLRRLLCLSLLLLSPFVQAEPRLTPFDAGSPAALRQANAGHAFVLVFWSVHCAPCFAEMAQWRAYRKQFPGIPIVQVATESLDESAAIVNVLDRYDAGTTGHRAFADDYAEKIRYAVDPAWRGETPKVYFYDREHKRIARSGALDPDWARRWFEQQSR
ncbi:MAG: redoxin domain-containing protein [Burkholderiales bacterium]|nr:redoxin domain-containing protein [Burkholderiales bacterium]